MQSAAAKDGGGLGQHLRDILREAAQLALARECSASIKVLVDLAAPVKDLDLLALYDKLYDSEEPPRFPMYVRTTMPTIQRELNARVGSGPEKEDSKMKKLSKNNNKMKTNKIKVRS